VFFWGGDHPTGTIELAGHEEITQFSIDTGTGDICVLTPLTGSGKYVLIQIETCSRTAWHLTLAYHPIQI
jgi:hypothetical protein